MSHIYLVRHGQASFGTGNYDQLSERGYAQARRLGQWWSTAGVDPALVVSGAMQRHRQTAESSLSGRELMIIPELNEYDHENVLHVYRPEFEDRAAMLAFLASQPHPAKAFQREFEAAVRRWVSGEHDSDYRESWPHFAARVRSGMQRLQQLAREVPSIAVYTSGGPIATMVGQMLELPTPRLMELTWVIANASVTHVRLVDQGERLALLNFNNAAHFATPEHSELLTYR